MRFVYAVVFVGLLATGILAGFGWLAAAQADPSPSVAAELKALGLPTLADATGMARSLPYSTRPGLQPATGAECPVGKKVYCDDKVPVCCLINGAWTCVKTLSDCHN